ncbi:hypothetical protein EJ08DRAFT_678813 [Tothia fuscella]|uniref:Uncharacterized protein n=1 Tax=Tothia fuscella TaxID=1048955 RepID=A0A9P4NSQ2_9PEZI|nr:hypothetical protein EJ08DRAFT_678813 [Tothia fuscella]
MEHSPRAHHCACFQSMSFFYAFSLLIFPSTAQRTWSRLPQVAVPSFTSARGPLSPHLDAELSLPESTMPAQFGGLPPFPTAETTSQSSTQSSDGTSTQGSVSLSTNSQPGASPTTSSSLFDFSPTITVGGFTSTDSFAASQKSASQASATQTSVGFATTFTTTVVASTGLGLASSAVGGIAGAATSDPAPVPQPVLKEQSVLGIAAGIGAWLLIIIGVLSCLLWRKRKKRNVLKSESGPPPEMGNAFTVYGDMPAPPIARLRIPDRAPSLPPQILPRAMSTNHEFPFPLRAHPISGSPLSPISPNAPYREEVQAPRGRSSSPIITSPRSNSPELPIVSTSPRGSFNISASTTSGTLTRNASTKSSVRGTSIKVRTLTKYNESPRTSDHISELPPSLGKLNIWLEENRRRSRMTESGSLGLTGQPPIV